MVQIADSTQAAHCLNTRPDLDIFLRPFVPRNGTQRHCDHLEKLQPIQCNPRERKIECYEVGLFLEAAVSEVATYGYWEVDGRTCAGPTWTPIVRCETFELLVECPPGKRITFVLNPQPTPVFLSLGYPVTDKRISQTWKLGPGSHPTVLPRGCKRRRIHAQAGVDLEMLADGPR